jgi:ADP-ribose pyrophosphatase YjhB (NUDIX family)
MGMPEYLRRLREKVGHDLLFLPSVACLIRDSEDRILLVKHVEGWWNLPGGFIDDPLETPAVAARREVREETSVEVDLVGIAGVFGGPDFHGVYDNGDEVAWVSTVFEARITHGTAKPADEETAEVRWASIDDALEIVTSAPWRHILISVRDGRAFDDSSV